VEEVVLPPQEEQIVTIEQGVFEDELAAEESEEEGQTPESGDIQEAENSSEQVETEAEPETETALSEPERSVEIVYEIIGGEVKEQGTQIKMTAVLSGFDETEPSYQWQYNDGSDWKDIEGATSSTYTLDVTEDNYNYSWRVSVMG
jgi:hypothetical protein